MTESSLPPEGSRPFDTDHAIQRIQYAAHSIKDTDRGQFKKRKAVWLLLEEGIEQKVERGELTRAQANDIRATDRATREINQRLDQRFGILTKAAVSDSLEGDINHALRVNEPLTLAILDMDHFRDVNNRYGHLVGDNVLDATVEHFDGVQDATFGRYGGDEFLLYVRGKSVGEVYPQIVDLNNTYPHQLEPVRAAHNIVEPVTMSIGITAYRHGESAEALIERADTVLYEAKAQGRNKVVHD